jgi:hypothetical protein
MAVGLGLAAVSLAGNPASGAFVGGTEASGNSVRSAASLCTSPQTVADPLTADTWVNQGQASINYGTHNALHVRADALMYEVKRSRKAGHDDRRPPVPAGSLR